HTARLQLDTDFRDNHTAYLLNRVSSEDESRRVDLLLSFNQRDDFAFFGVGPRTAQAAERRYGAARGTIKLVGQLDGDVPGWNMAAEVSAERSHYFCPQRTPPSLCDRKDTLLQRDPASYSAVGRFDSLRSDGY